MSRRAVSLVCVALLALTLAACGSSKKSSSSSSSGSKTTEKSNTTEAAAGDSSADKAKAEAINLKAEDFPSGWTSKPASTDTSDSTDKELYTCSGLPDPATNTTATVSSPDFSQGTFTNASSEVRFAKSNDVAKKVLDAFKNDKFQTCLKQTFDKQMKDQASGAGGTIGESKIESLPAPSGADGAAFRMTVPISASGFNISFYIDFTVLQKGRAVVTLAAFNGNSPFDSTLKGQLTSKLTSRMASNA
jgi:hypothetical protein